MLLAVNNLHSVFVVGTIKHSSCITLQRVKLSSRFLTSCFPSAFRLQVRFPTFNTERSCKLPRETRDGTATKSACQFPPMMSQKLFVPSAKAACPAFSWMGEKKQSRLRRMTFESGGLFVATNDPCLVARVLQQAHSRRGFALCPGLHATQ